MNSRKECFIADNKPKLTEYLASNSAQGFNPYAQNQSVHADHIPAALSVIIFNSS